MKKRCIVVSFLFYTLLLVNCKKKAVTQTPSIVRSPDTVVNESIPPLSDDDTIPDLRNITKGNMIYSDGYMDQPYIIHMADSTWLCEYTHGSTVEGGLEDIMLSRSNDLKTWSPSINIEPVLGYIQTSYGVPYITPYGRIYLIYNYNGDNIQKLNNVWIRNDTLGWMCYKYSDDNGLTWSKRYRIPLRETAVDLTNDWQGAVQMFWTICKPIHSSIGLLYSFTKIHKYSDATGEEGWVMNCPNIDQERNPANLQWQLLPGSDVGIKNSIYTHEEEFNLVQLDNNNLYCISRTDAGVITFSVSNDLGNSWSTPAVLKYAMGTANDRNFKNPRACPRIFKCQNHKYLLWFHNNSTTSFSYRNIVWVSGGTEVNGTIRWSEPEVILYSNNAAEGMSYPDLVEDNGNYYFTETQKSVARIHQIPTRLLNDIWQQGYKKQAITNGLRQSVAGDILPGTRIKANPQLFTSLKPNDGFTITFNIKLSTNAINGNIFTNVSPDANKGVKIYYSANNTVTLSLNDSTRNLSIVTDKNSITPNVWHTVSFVVDQGPKLITAMVDGKLCDGGADNNFGWVQFTQLNDVNTNGHLLFANTTNIQLKNFAVYARPLRTSELVSNYLAQ